MRAPRRRLEQALVPPQPWHGHCRPSRRPPSLMEELIEEILLRLPPEDPASLVRAALVCKPWRRLVSSPRFRRRFLEFHRRRRTPPTLGFMCNYMCNGCSFVRTSAFSPLQQLQREYTSRPWSALDARHGRVLLRAGGGEFADVPVTALVVWDPITDEMRELPALPRPTKSCTAAVLCAAGAGCDHHCCHRGPFRVVFVGTDFEMFICTYSSDLAMWSEPISIQRQCYWYNRIYGGYSPSVLLGNELYFGIPRTNAALKYDLELHDKYWIQLPNVDYSSQTSVLTTMDGGRLVLVRLSEGVLRVWLRMNTPEEGNFGWTKFKVIDLRKKRLHVRSKHIPRACVVGFADGVVFVTVNSALYTVDLETCMVKKQKQEYNGGEIQNVFPYMHFYSPCIMTLLGS